MEQDLFIMKNPTKKKTIEEQAQNKNPKVCRGVSPPSLPGFSEQKGEKKISGKEKERKDN